MVSIVVSLIVTFLFINYDHELDLNKIIGVNYRNTKLFPIVLSFNDEKLSYYHQGFLNDNEIKKILE